MKRLLKAFELILIVIFLFFALLSARPYAVYRAYPVRYAQTVKKYAEENAFSAAFLFAVIRTESGFRPRAVSEKGAVGLMQILPSTAEFIAGRNGYDYMEEYLYTPEYNIRIGCRYLSYLRARFADERTYLAAYNAGEGTVANWLKNPKYSPCGKILAEIPYPETRRYVEKVENAKNKYEKYYSFS